MIAVIVPVGVTRETVEGVLRELPKPDIIIAATVPGYEKAKKPIIETLRGTATALGAKFYLFTARPGEVEDLVSIYKVLMDVRPQKVFLVGVTGTRYLLPVLVTVLLKFWRDARAEVYLVHGVEGERYSIEPLPGFFATAMRLSNVQKRLLSIIYESEKLVSGKELMEGYGFTRSVYYVLADLERKGLLRVRRGRIEKTFPGKLVFSLLKASGGVDGSV